MYIKGAGGQETQNKLGGTCTVRMGWKLKVTVTYNWAFPFSGWKDSYTLTMFLYFHALSRSIWWSSNPTSSEIPRLDGKPQSAQSWVCLSKKVWSFPAEVGLPWTSLSLLLPSLVLVPWVFEVRELFWAALTPHRMIFLGEREARPLSLLDWTSNIPSALHLQVQITLSRNMAHVGRTAPRRGGCAGEASWLQTGRIQNGTVSSLIFLIWDWIIGCPCHCF